MFKKIVYSLLIVASMYSCKSEEQEQEIERLESENKSLSRELNAKDSTLMLFEESFTTIQRNLGLISEREQKIALNSGDVPSGDESRDEITKDIQAINNLLQENKSTIDNLKKQMNKYGAETAGFKKLIDQLGSDISAKEEQISYLKENLTAANFTIEILNEMLDSAEFRNEIQMDMIGLQNSQLNTAYYAIGTFKELKDNGVLEKDGTVIGLGGTKQLKDNFNKKYFAQVDLTKLQTIPLNASKIKLVTVHPDDSYSIDGENEKSLRITKPIEFWSVSKYLVVMIE